MHNGGLVNILYNWTYWSEHLIEQAILGYTNIVGFFFWPIMFTAVIGYVYLKNQSAVMAAVAILIIFVAFSGSIIGIEPWYSIMYIFVSITIAALVLIFIVKRRR